MQTKVHKKSVRRRLMRIGFVTCNVLLLTGVSLFVWQARTPASANLVAYGVASDDVAINPLDQVSSADIAVNIARTSGMVESIAVKNQAESQDDQLALAPLTNNVVNKQQVVTTAFKSNKDIQNYKVVAGDTVNSIAAKFNVTSDSIKWSNSLSGNNVNADTQLVIPPTGYSGIVYTVKDGDTIDSLAQKYRADKGELTRANDAEIAGLKVGDRIIIPGGQQPVPVAPVRNYSGFAFGSTAIYGYNGYDYGWCTWYVANRVSIPANWGNANRWDDNAPLAGWTVSSTPRVGAIAQSNRGWEGHVGFVEAVSEDGTMIKYSDMNGLAGWGSVGYSDWVPVHSRYANFIYR